MANNNLEAVYPLSPMQQGMLFHSLYAPESGVYVEQMSCKLTGDLNAAAFEQAWQRVVDRNTILRTCFAWKNTEQMLQAVYRQIRIPVPVEDWRQVPPSDQPARLEEFLAADRARGFDISKAPLNRMALMRLSADTWYFVWTHHHALLDGWSVPLLLQEVFTYYEAFRQGREPVLPPARPYRDYINWIRRQDQKKAEQFWREALAGFAAPTPLVLDRLYQPDGAGQAAGYEELTVSLSLETTAALQALSQKHQLTMNTLVQGAWALLLSHYSGENDVLFGATVSGRPADLPGCETMIGLFINTLPVRAKIDPQQSLIPWLKDLQARQVDARLFEYTQLVKIQEWSEVPQAQPLFNSILVYENYPVDAAGLSRATSLKIDEVRSNEQTNYPLTVIAGTRPALALKILYDRSRFERDTVEHILAHLRVLVESMLTEAERPACAVDYLPLEERETLLHQWDGNIAPFPDSVSITELIELQVTRTPEAVAVEYGDQTLTYRELDQRANRLAAWLRRNGVAPDRIAAVSFDDCPDLMVAILAVLKAGGAYLPLDPTLPPERIRFMLEDSQAGVLLTHSAHLEQIQPRDIRVLCLDTEWEQVAAESEKRLAPAAGPHNLAYVIYTSGSTGTPKGTLLEHYGLCNLTGEFAWIANLHPGARLLLFASISFDASVVDIFTTLITGATLVFAPVDTLHTPEALYALMREKAVTHITLPPAMLAALPGMDLPDLATLISAGDACSWELVDKWSAGRRFVNGYGPTEATVGSSFWIVEPLSHRAVHVPIGQPIHNVQYYILDSALQPVPVGVPGELHIGGAGLARGYLNRPDLTEQRFIENPFHPGTRLYKTGDLARYLPDGQIEFLGRADFQVKIRGFRIELGEIEAALRAHPYVSDAVVVAREDSAGEKSLAAYFISSNDSVPTPAELRAFLRTRLPDYMLPPAYVCMQGFPLNTAGKVNRKELPEPDLSRDACIAPFLAPRTPAEEIICNLFAALLNQPRVSVADNFFELGGHSLLATSLAARLRQAFSVDVPLRAVFEHPTPADLAGYLAALAPSTPLPPITPVDRDAGPLATSFAQQRLWFLDQLDPGNLFFNLPAAVRMTGQLDMKAMQAAIDAMVERHEALRTRFAVSGGDPIQVIAPAASCPIPLTDLSALPEAERENQAQTLARLEIARPFDLARGPLLRAALYRLSPTDHILLFTFHHIIADGWSLSIFISDLAALYAAAHLARPAALPPLPIQYADFAAWQRSALSGPARDRLLAFWKDALRGAPPLLDLPTDRPRPAMKTSPGSVVSLTLPPALSLALSALAQQEGATLFMTLLAAFHTLLARYARQDDVCTGSAVAARSRPDLEPLIGFFVNTLVLRSNLSDNPSFRLLLARTRDMTLAAFAHQDLPFETLVEALAPSRNLAYTPLFQVGFDFQLAPAAPLSLPGLSLAALPLHSGQAAYDLLLSCSPSPDGILASLEFNTDLFDPATAERLLAAFHSLLAAAAANPDTPVANLPLLSPAQVRAQVLDWNNTAAPYPLLPIHALFESWAERTPDAPALILDQDVLSYQALNARANQLAHFLLARSLPDEFLAAISTSRSFDMITAILAVLKAGGAYLPLDPAYPSERLAFMLADAAPAVLLTQTPLLPALPVPATLPSFCLDTDAPLLAALPDTNPNLPISPDHLAYAIYTSGSTGAPKAALLPHRGLANLTAAHHAAFGIGPASRVLQFAPFSFDASVWDTFMALANGAALVLAHPDQLSNPAALVELLDAQAVSIATLPPSLIALLPLRPLPHFSTLVSAGEACPAEIVRAWAPGRAFFNAYGPTEVTVCPAWFRCDHPDDPNPPPIGRPLQNCSLYILDPFLQPLPPGVPGELCVASPGLARGYLNRPDLTALKFVPNPFAARPGERIYRTGDLCRFLPDGNIQFLGRIDSQIKLRGFRIELGEIEEVLRALPAVTDAAATVRPDPNGDPRLLAYFVPADPASPPSPADLRAHLRTRLPEYMLPAAFIPIPALPISPSGKVDRKALPEPDLSLAAAAAPYLAPRTDLEASLAAICADLLGLQRVGVEDNFFDLGGHSLLATRFVSRIRETAGVELPLRTLFEYPTIAAIAEVVEQSRSAGPSEEQKLAELLSHLDELSDEEVQKLLGELDSPERD